MSRSIPQASPEKPLGGRYKVLSQLGIGGFGRTFLAQDLHLPGHPHCVLKQLKPQFRSDDTLQMARRCFNTEAEVLYQLGSHDQIPRLLAHFEDNQEFYLAQEFVAGDPVTREFQEGHPWSEKQTVELLNDVLQVLVFVHQQQVIHRDLKPSNLIRRQSDGKIVLIDFGAVKQVSTQEFDHDTGLTNLTISIGTQGYMPNEQLAGKPRFSSDVFAVGVLGIQALTGLHPRHFDDDDKGEIAWHDRAPQASPNLKAILDRMVRYDFRERYANAIEAQTALASLSDLSEEAPPAFQPPELIDIRSSSLRASVGSQGTTTGALSSGHRDDRADAMSDRMAEQLTGRGNTDFQGIDITLAGQDAIATALWVQSPPGQANAFSPPSSAGFTRAVGSLHPVDASAGGGALTADSKPSGWQRLMWVVIAAAAAMGAIVAAQTLLPQSNPLTTRSGMAPSTSPGAVLPPTSDDPVELVGQADQLLQQQQYEGALAYYDRAISLKFDYADAYAGRCETLNQLNNPEEAIVACNDALAYQPGSAKALWSKGNALMLQGRTYEALKLYEDVTTADANFAPGWVKKGVALQALGRSAEAIYALDQAITLQRNISEAWKTRGAALFVLQRYEEALTSLDKALQLQDPDDPETVQLRQQAREKLKR